MPVAPFDTFHTAIADAFRQCAFHSMLTIAFYSILIAWCITLKLLDYFCSKFHWITPAAEIAGAAAYAAFKTARVPAKHSRRAIFSDHRVRTATVRQPLP
jgi:hypothetical protein